MSFKFLTIFQIITLIFLPPFPHSQLIDPSSHFMLYYSKHKITPHHNLKKKLLNLYVLPLKMNEIPTKTTKQTHSHKKW